MTDPGFDFETLPGARRVAMGPPRPAQRFIVLTPRRLLHVVALLVVDDRRDDAEPHLVGVANEDQLRDLGEALQSSPGAEGSMVPIGPPGPPQRFIAQVALDDARALLSIGEDGSDATVIAESVTDAQAHQLGEACAVVARWLHAHAR